MIVDRISMEQATLLRLAADVARQQVKERSSILSAYLIGSVAAGERPLGEATDLDLVLIDGDPPARRREVLPLSDGLVADLHIHAREDYRNPKALRVDPWRGPEMCEPIFLYDPQHFFELAQASARGQFHRPDHVVARAQAFLELARRHLQVNDFGPETTPQAPVSLEGLCLGLMCAANAVVTLTGFPGAGRRLLLRLEAAAARLGRPALYDGFLAALAPNGVSVATARAWVAEWTTTYQAAQSEDVHLLHPARLPIYLRGFTAQIEADRATDLTWLMLFTWQSALRRIPAATAGALGYVDLLDHLGMAEAAGFQKRVAAAIAYGRQCQAEVGGWAQRNGA